MRWRRIAAVALAVWAGACTPALDWREVRPEDSGALALFPCKPARQARNVRLAGTSVRMAMHACRADDAVYALAFADVGDPGRVSPALSELREAALANLGAHAAAPLQLAVKGSTPNPHAGALQFEGRRPDGAPLRESLALFARGTRVYQASVLGSTLDPAVVRTFFDGVQVMH